MKKNLKIACSFFISAGIMLVVNFLLFMKEIDLGVPADEAGLAISNPIIAICVAAGLLFLLLGKKEISTDDNLEKIFQKKYEPRN